MCLWDCTCTIVDINNLDADIEDENCPLHGRQAWLVWLDGDHTLSLTVDQPVVDGTPLARWVDVTWREAKKLTDNFLFGG